MEQIETNQLQRNKPVGLQEDNKCCKHKLDVFDQLGNFLVIIEIFWFEGKLFDQLGCMVV